MSSCVALWCLLLLHSETLGFEILAGPYFTHLEITESAILNTTVQVCYAVAQTDGTDFTFPPQPFTAENVAAACKAPSSRRFRLAITSITLRNAWVDIAHVSDPEFHFDREMIIEGRKIITDGIQAVKASNKQKNFDAARRKLGEILHPLQDFYSHSNWVELGYKAPNSNLIRSDTNIGNIAAKSRATCRSCDGSNCNNNILEDVIQEKILTTGYFGFTKPNGKCSHGGKLDLTSNTEPKGGINKDKFDSSHGYLHSEAANVAKAATSELLENIRGAVGDKLFLQMLGITKGSSKALCFVIDTTKSMSDVIGAVKTITSSIISSKVGTEDEPSLYILVPFNDPGFGPLMTTTEADVFKNAVNSLTASGGLDQAELSLSGLRLALSGAPTNSEIFVFTDAPAKDGHLKSTVIALIEQTQTVVNFMITASTATNRRRRSDDNWQQQSRISASEAQLYRELAQHSGGQAIEVAKSELPVASSIIAESTRSSLVTLLQASRSPGVADSFLFIYDGTLTSATVYITGSSVTFTLTSPNGDTQQSTDSTGSLITSSQSVGNFQTLQLKAQVGQWKMNMVSPNPYTLKVIGHSPVDFLFNFVEVSQGPSQGYDALERRPQTGVSGNLLVSVTGSRSATVTEVALVDSSTSAEIRGVVVPQGNGSFLAQFDKMPSAPFAVRMKGQVNTVPQIVFQRQSPTNFKTSNLIVTANSDAILVPGTPFSTGGSANGTVNISAPLNTPSGTDVTLTIEAGAPGGTDTNYVLLRISVVNTVTDFIAPVCQLLSKQFTCPKNCSSSSWELAILVTDGAGGTGVDHVSLIQGNGTMIASPGPGNTNTTLVSYSASCCSPVMELLVVDRVGNEGSCLYSAAVSLSTTSLLFLSALALGFLILADPNFQ
ncbi:hypothetical protein Q5P01_019282 [Channa striata]|uniref:von Willebrand factor A domain-containing protein 7-like n=1 Tax=Channa striata TaxID=64152 RepID=A0AA88M235_CHASR|nr:hypothetical protein Q5P01_019282 [Channa striata]